MPKKFAVITGASSGIGYELTKLFAQDGINLVLVARQHDVLIRLSDELREKYKVEVIVIEKDLSKVEEVQSVYDQVQELHLDVEYLVNSAGLGDYGQFIKTDLQKELTMININIVALTYLTKVFALDMAKKGSGKILNLGSIASFFPGPLMAVYYSTKAYVLRFGLAIAEEFRGTGVTITTLCPGPTESKFKQVANMTQSKIYKDANIPTAQEVAEFGYDGMMQGKVYMIHGMKNVFYSFLAVITPLAWQARIVRHVQGLATN